MRDQESTNAICEESLTVKPLPNKTKICSVCILPDSVPNISFDNRGVCNFCCDYEKKEAPMSPNFPQLEKNMLKMLRVNPKKHPYDCICMYSGGKDSSYMLDQLVNKYQLRVLAFTFDNWFIPRETFENINRVLKGTNSDHVILKPSWKLNKTLFSAGFNDSDRLSSTKELAYMIGHACWPCFVQIALQTIKIAVDKDIPNVVVGTTPGQIRQKKYDLVSKYSDLADVNRTMIQPMIKLLKITKQKEALAELDMPFFKKLKVLSLRLIPFYEFVPYDESVVMETVESKFGWRKPQNVDSCSSNCQLNSLGIEVHKKKYGISPYVIPLARDVRQGLVKREDALTAVNGELNQNLVKYIAERFEVNL